MSGSAKKKCSRCSRCKCGCNKHQKVAVRQPPKKNKEEEAARRRCDMQKNLDADAGLSYPNK